MRVTPLPASFRDLEPNRLIVRCIICGVLTFADELCGLESEAKVCAARQEFERLRIN